MNDVNVLLCASGRRPYLPAWFKDALVLNSLTGSVIVADCDSLAPAQAFADLFLPSPPVTSEEYGEWLRDTLRQHDVALAISINDFELSAWAKLPAHEPDLSPLLRLSAETQAVCEDKLRMAEALTKAGVKTPPTLEATEKLPAALGSGAVLKGRFGSGSRGLRRVTPSSYAAAIVEATREVTDRSGVSRQTLEEARTLMVVQPFIDGQEFGLDVVADLNGRYKGCLARRKLAMRSGETDRAVTVDGSQFDELGEALTAAIPHRGTIDVDVMTDEQGTKWVIDVNPRFGGGYPFSHTAGAHLPATLISWIAGSPPAPEWLQPAPDVTAAKYVDIASIPGRKHA